MRWFGELARLFDEQDIDDGTGTGGVSSGAPYEHDNTAEQDDEGTDTGDAVPSVDDLKKQIADLQADRDRQADDAKFWAGRAQRGNPTPAAGEVHDEDEDEEEPEPVRRVAEKPEALLTDMATEGDEALRKRGFVRVEDVDKLVDRKVRAAVREGQAYTDATRQDAEFGQRIQREFPEIHEEARKLNADKNYRSTSPLWIETNKIYNEMVADDPDLKNKRGTLITAAKHATQLLKVGGKSSSRSEGTGVNRSRESDRRERLERNMPSSRSAARERDEDDHGGAFSPDQTLIMRHLKVTPQQFEKHREAPRAAKGRR